MGWGHRRPAYANPAGYCRDLWINGIEDSIVGIQLNSKRSALLIQRPVDPVLGWARLRRLKPVGSPHLNAFLKFVLYAQQHSVSAASRCWPYRAGCGSHLSLIVRPI